jgi:indole-3-glycerol phosphate synthase
MDMKEAIREAVQIALEALPPPLDETAKIDLAVVSISSLYDGNASPSEVVPAVLEAAKSYGKGIQHLVGSTCGGYIGSRATFQQFPPLQAEENDDEDDEKKKKANAIRACKPVEQEGVPGVSVVLSVLPDVELQTFHVLGNDVPDDYGRVSTEVWRQAIGLSSQDTSQAVFLLPSPAFSKDLDDLLRGFENHFPETTVFGAVASTVSSLSRARLFRHDVNEKGLIQTMADGCVGVVMSGDIEVKTMVAQGAKPVGGVYQIVKGEESTISAIALDETATELVRQAEALDEDGDLDEDDNDDGDDEFAEFRIAKSEKAAQMAAAYAKARIPKPVLAEANFLMKTLSDDDQAFMRKTLLVGLERGGALGRTPSELARLAEGKGHSFTVHQVASAAMKEGSVTLSLGSVNIKSGTRMRFFVREADFARKEVEALWMGYKKRALSATLKGEENPFVPSGCLLFPTLDRGNKFFLGKPGFESLTASQFLPTVSCISGFFSNGVIGVLDTDEELAGSERATLSGSASGYVLIGSKSARPVFTPTKESSDKAVKGNTNNNAASAAAFDTEEKAPRDENGELILKRREVHSGRALTVSTVEWSVAEKTAYPTSKLEGFMWDKETEVDRFRERVPLANLLSQCKLGAVDPTKPKPRNWISPVKKASKDGQFVIIPECKRSEPGMGSLRKRYDLRKLAKDFTTNGAPAMSVNCDGVLFGGSLEDLTKAREASSKAKLESATPVDDNNLPPILASDLILYPYQLYKMRLAGADAVNLLVGALAAKDLVYLTKIAKSVQMQSLLTVTSAAQLEKVVTAMDAGTVDGLIVSNRELEDFSFDMTGQQALNILQSDAMKFFQEKHPDAPILVDGRVGIIEAPDSMSGTRSRKGYIEQLKEAGATGAIIGGGLVGDFASDLSSFVL